MEQAEKELARAIELGDTAAVVEAHKKMIALSAENDRANQAKLAQQRQQLSRRNSNKLHRSKCKLRRSNSRRRPDPKAQALGFSK